MSTSQPKELERSNLIAYAAAAARAFAKGCFTVSWTGTLGSVTVAIGIYALLAYLITPARFIAAPRRFMSDREDVYPIIKAEALRIASGQTPSDKSQIVLIGDSAFREGITSLGDLQRRISQHTSQPFELTSLMAGGLTQLDAINLCGVISGHVHGRVILESSPFWMARALEDVLLDKVIDRLGFDTAAFTDELRLVGEPCPRWSENFFLRNWRFMLCRAPAFARGLKALPEPAMHSTHFRGTEPEKAFVRSAGRLRAMVREISHRAPETLAIYRRMIRGIQSNGAEVTLLEAPLNPRLAQGKAGSTPLNRHVMGIYQNDRTLLAKEMNVSVWDLNRAAELTGADFHDAFHISREDARQRFTEALAIRIAESLDPARKHQS